MSERHFFLPETRKRVAGAIEEVEKQTAAEIVVAVRKRCARYVVVDVAAGTVAAYAALLAVMYLPQELAIDKLPHDVGIAFWMTFAITSLVPTIKRLLTPRSVMNGVVRSAARAAFHDMRIARTRGRTGILVFVAMFERKVEIVCDTGVPPEAIAGCVAALEASGRAADLDAFLAAIKSMGPPLAAVLPVQPDDVDELPNEPEVA